MSTAFRLPLDPAVPVILASAGTGVAPVRGVVLDRMHTGERGPLLSYFGCDHPTSTTRTAPRWRRRRRPVR